MRKGVKCFFIVLIKLKKEVKVKFILNDNKKYRWKVCEWTVCKW